MPRISLPAQHGLATVLLVTLIFVLFSPILYAPFWAVDEWEVLQFSSPELLHPQMNLNRQGMDSLDDYVRYIVNDFQTGGRFRPMWHLVRFAEAAFFGRNAAVWHAALLVMASATAILVYAAGRVASMGWLSALLIPIWLIVATQANELWWRIGPNETSGLVFLALAVFAGVKAADHARPNRWDAVLLISLILAGLSKESFALAIPAILFGRVTLSAYRRNGSWREILRNVWWVLLIGLLTAAVCLLFVWLAGRHGGWGADTVGLSIQSFMPWNWLDDLGMVAPLLVWFLPAFLAFVIAPNLPASGIAGPWVLAGFAAFAMWVVPQLILYSSAVFTGRFLYPMLGGAAALNGWGLAVLTRRRLWALTALAVIPTILVMGLQARDEYNEVGRLSAQSRAFDAMLESTLAAADDRAIVIAADPALYPEAVCAIPSLIGNKGAVNPLYFQPVQESGDAIGEQFTGYLESCLGGEQYVTSANLTADEVGAVILMSSREGFDAYAPGWYQVADWQLVNHTANFETIRLNASAPPVSVTFTSLEPTTGS
ncbi:MAG: hypothetical protein U0452_10485 [Anaerolineae bacterium]